MMPDWKAAWRLFASPAALSGRRYAVCVSGGYSLVSLVALWRLEHLFGAARPKVADAAAGFVLAFGHGGTGHFISAADSAGYELLFVSCFLSTVGLFLAAPRRPAERPRGGGLGQLLMVSGRKLALDGYGARHLAVFLVTAALAAGLIMTSGAAIAGFAAAHGLMR